MDNYEKKYKEALGWIQSLYNGLHGKTKEDAEHYFPELKENEDEKIKRCISDVVRKYGMEFATGTVTKEKMLAWLEKQGEQNSTPKFKIGDTIHKIGENTVFPRTIEKIEDGDYVCNNSHSFVNIKFQDDYELVEQKSANKVEPRFEVGDCIRYRGDNYKIKDIETTKHGFIYNVAVIGKPSDSEEVKTAIGCAAEKDIVKIEQSSTDWSEEDEEKLNSIIEVLGENSLLVQWLKSFKYRVQPQLNQEWSEEDEKIYNEIIDFFLGDIETRCITIDKQRHF